MTCVKVPRLDTLRRFAAASGVPIEEWVAESKERKKESPVGLDRACGPSALPCAATYLSYRRVVAALSDSIVGHE
jgi:hypothetical protein